jgi:hypothetical protein
LRNRKCSPDEADDRFAREVPARRAGESTFSTRRASTCSASNCTALRLQARIVSSSIGGRPGSVRANRNVCAFQYVTYSFLQELFGEKLLHVRSPKFQIIGARINARGGSHKLKRPGSLVETKNFFTPSWMPKSQAVIGCKLCKCLHAQTRCWPCTLARFPGWWRCTDARILLVTKGTWSRVSLLRGNRGHVLVPDSFGACGVRLECGEGVMDALHPIWLPSGPSRGAQLTPLPRNYISKEDRETLVRSRPSRPKTVHLG